MKKIALKKVAEALKPVVEVLEEAKEVNDSEFGEKINKRATELVNKLIEERIMSSNKRDKAVSDLTYSKEASLNFNSKLVDQVVKLRESYAESIGTPKEANEGTNRNTRKSDEIYFNAFGSGKVR